MMIRIRIELALKLRQGLHFRRFVAGIEIGLGAGQPIDARILFLQRAQHVVERPVLHHQDHDGVDRAFFSLLH